MAIGVSRQRSPHFVIPLRSPETQARRCHWPYLAITEIPKSSGHPDPRDREIDLAFDRLPILQSNDVSVWSTILIEVPA